MNQSLSPQSRDRALAAMSDDDGLDVLVVGGGITGAGIALDAATRGLRTGVVEAQDWAAGTSSRSSKLVHGGLRYLQMLDFALVAEALKERDLLLNDIAPHLVSRVPFLYPLHHRVWERAYVTAGIGMYDALAKIGARTRGEAMPVHRHRTHSGVKRLFPDIRDDALIGAVQYWDAKVDDARLVLSLVRTAVAYGALAASRTQVTELVKDETGRVTGAVVQDLHSGRSHYVRARHVIAATGVWTEQTQALGGTEGGLKVLASKGIHIVVPRERIRGESGIILQTEKSVLFIIPWDRYWLIGTTDTAYHEDLRHPVASRADVDYVLEHANAILDPPLTREDVVGTFAGLRPLLQPGTKDADESRSTKVSREHTVTEAAPGLTVIAGGKLTTYRVMAADAVDHALGRQEADRLPSVTAGIPLLGAVGLEAVRRRRERIAAAHGWEPQRVEHLLGRYGSELPELLGMIEQDPTLARPLAGAPAYLRAEIAFGVTHEGALHLEDLLVHRTRLTYEVADHGLGALEEIAEVAAPLLGWDAEHTAAEVAAYRRRVAAQQEAAGATSDAEAEAARLAVEDVVPMAAMA